MWEVTVNQLRLTFSPVIVSMLSVIMADNIWIMITEE